MRTILSSLLLGLASFAYAQVPNYAAPSGMISWYPLDGNGTDATANGNDGGSTDATPTTDRFGTENAALEFSENIMNIENTSSFDKASVTVSAWIKTTNSSGAYQSVFSHFIDAYFGYWLGVRNGKACWFLAGGADMDVLSNTNVNDDEWHMITGVYNDQVGQVYVDGQLETEAEFLMFVLPCPTDIGSDFLGEPFFGSIDEIGVWDRPLTSCEIEHLHSGEELTINTSITLSDGTLMATATDAEYQWVNCDDFVPVEGATDQSFTPTVEDDYAVYITVDGCTVLSECVEVVADNLEENESSQSIRIFPNPSAGRFAVSTDLQVKILVVWDHLGKRVASLQTNQFPVEVDLSAQLTSGTYYLSFEDEKGSVLKLLPLVIE